MAFAVKGGACFVFSLSNARGSEFAHVRERVARHREQAARRGPSVGIALSSGAARGLAHIGVLTALEQAGIEIDLIAGCSIGAVIGAMAACGMGPHEMAKIASQISRVRMLSYTDITLPTKGLLSGQKVQQFLKKLFGETPLEETAIPLVLAATDILTGEEVVIDSGPIVDGVRASISIPGVFVPHQIAGRCLVDGGLVNPVPVDYLRAAGIDVCISVNVVPRVDRKYIKEPSAIDILLNAFDIMEHRVILSKRQTPDVEICPSVDRVSGVEFWRAPELIELGMEAALGHIDNILELVAEQ